MIYIEDCLKIKTIGNLCTNEYEDSLNSLKAKHLADKELVLAIQEALVEKASVANKKTDETLRKCLIADDAELDPKKKTDCTTARANAVVAHKTMIDAGHL